MKKLVILLLTVSPLLFSLSCKKFIEEDQVSTLTYEYFKTDLGLEDLVRSAYSPLRYKFDNEQAYCLWNFGIDEFILGDQFNYSYYNTYEPRLNAADNFLNGFWVNNYGAINRCNLGIQLLNEFNNPTSKILGTDAQKNQRLGELRFLRGYYYFQLVQQFGGVPLVLNSSDSIRTDFPRSSIADVYNAIIPDLKFASDNLNTAADVGRALKGSADHFLAKVYLTRGSAVTDQRGQKATDMDSAAYYADLVISSNKFILEPDYMNLWAVVYPKGYPNTTVTIGTPPYNFDGVSGVASGETSKLSASNNSKEIIFAAQFSTNIGLASPSGSTAGGNRTHEYFTCQYDGGIPGLIRNSDNFNGRPFRRMGPSDYTIDLFDRKNDSRFYKSFRTTFYANTTGGKTPVGDTIAQFIVNDKNTTLTAAQVAGARYITYARYYRDASNNLQQGFNNNKYLSLVKHFDPIRLTSAFNEERGVRNGILARLAETYLIAAEAYGRKGNYVKALEYINKIRQRAAYHANEFRNPATWMYDGSTKGDVTDTYANLMATDVLFTTNAPSENYPPGVGSTEERFIHFMLNERTRELLGEFCRWEDLVRTELLYSRTKLFNKDATSIMPYHKLRPIPQQQIDLTTQNGQLMDATQKKNYQNPGY
ncbi:RagB/SusD family nutrient uptake outer membrane protein [Paraflavitalea soli]|uniref:RagB/SusD family nutrient uptake outer membrane protein n=1 Tax=Paraflavitalea soli TaxID=2315862 RepID=A0A3B7MW99_9BACT|nr:RagB/SusD family nutrient uptake outer membrane protein [Paraflavitalea soli]AXY75945.1 RagB/SusD family nutrient uptake outer membrane protein [Paraflavitalea soli]